MFKCKKNIFKKKIYKNKKKFFKKITYQLYN